MSNMDFLVVTVNVDGTIDEQTWENNERGQLKNLQATVDGYIEAVYLDKDLTLWVNEEGLFTQEPNIRLSEILAAWGELRTPLHGNGVFTGGSDDDGNTLPLSRENADMILAWG